jgi:hypothetical protein
LEPQRRGESFDTSQAEHLVTAKGLIEASGSPAFIYTTDELHCRPCLEIAVGYQPSIFRAAKYRSAVCP